MKNIDVAKKYFEVSNRSDFDDIADLLTECTSYSSQNTGLYLGVDQIIEMQKDFHGSFESLEWKIGEIYEEKPGIICVEFDFTGIKKGEKVQFSAVEYILVVNNKIQHIEIRNK